MKKYQTLSQLLNEAYTIAISSDDHLPFGDESEALRDLRNYLANAIDEAEYLEANHNGPFN